jgi:hypothetical protein
LRQIGPTCFSGSLNLWNVAFPRVCDPQIAVSDCVREMRSWAAKMLKAVGVTS